MDLLNDTTRRRQRIFGDLRFYNRLGWLGVKGYIWDKADIVLYIAPSVEVPWNGVFSGNYFRLDWCGLIEELYHSQSEHRRVLSLIMQKMFWERSNQSRMESETKVKWLEAIKVTVDASFQVWGHWLMLEMGFP